ncbi:hypothetical protein ABW20_dc0102154 [Dactylellina cionopaga]|nr:hypothetical protein ABW20_dc0102154 [Dactylellina cionopaga]
MKASTVIALVASLAAVNAQGSTPSITDIPQCALSCALGSLSNTGCASQTDFACICAASSFINGITSCVQGACTQAELETTIKVAQGLCSSAGVSLSVPPIAGATTSAGTSAASSEASSAVTSAVSSAVSSAVTSIVSSAPVSSYASTTGAAPTTVATSSRATNGSVTAPPQPTGTEPGAAGRNTVALGGLGAIIALVAALL